MAKLYFRYGAMNSGKTTALMQVAYNYKERGMRVLILKPAIDTKGQDSILSRLGISCKVDKLVTPDMDVVELVRAQHEKAVRILTDNRAKLDELAQYLYQKETITGEEFMEILNREPAQAQ